MDKLALILALTLPASAASRVQCGEVISTNVPPSVSYCALLPPSYDTAKTKTFPILYFLHGLGDNHQTLINTGIWNAVERLQADNKIIDFVIVTPNGGRSFYINAKGSGGASAKRALSRYEDFFLKEFIPQIERTFRAGRSRSRRAIAGISMGGYGALRTAFKYPRMFSAVAAHAPALIEKMPRGAENTPVGMILGNVFGSPFDPTYWENQSPIAFARTAKLSGMKIYFDCGDQDEYGFDAGARALQRVLKSRAIKYEGDIYPGRHDWQYFSTHLPTSLQFISRSFR